MLANIHIIEGTKEQVEAKLEELFKKSQSAKPISVESHMVDGHIIYSFVFMAITGGFGM